MSMFDPLRNRYQLRCPSHDEDAWVSVSEFRRIKRLHGASAPAVFRVAFTCGLCDRIHESLVSHDRLDYAPIAHDSLQTYTNLQTGSRELVGAELGEMTGQLIRQGSWPWTFYCHPESAVRPGFPSSLRFISETHDHHHDQIGVMVRCFACSRLSVNLVSRAHLDVPFHNDHHITYVAALVDDKYLSAEEAFRHQLASGNLSSEWLRAA